MRSKKYNPPKGAFQNNCSISNCKQKRVICNNMDKDGKTCGMYGHPDFYKHSETDLIPIVEHAHFLINKDTGRNVFHKVGEPFTCPEHLKVYTWRTIRGADRYLKMPVEVRENLGWNEDVVE